LRLLAAVLNKSALPMPWPPQWASAGARQNRNDNSGAWPERCSRRRD